MIVALVKSLIKLLIGVFFEILYISWIYRFKRKSTLIVVSWNVMALM